MNAALMPHVFVSYVREDRRLVENLCTILKRNEIEVWLDREKIRPGERWQVAIRRAIEEGAFFTACFSTAYNVRENSYMNTELTIAIDQLRSRPTNRAWFIPILFEGGVVPDRPIGGGETLRDIQWVDLAEDWDDGVERILSVLRPPQPTAKPSSQEIKREAQVILVADLIGFSTSIEQLGEEELRDIMDHFLKMISEAVEAQQGKLSRFMGDGLVATFELAPDAIRCAQQIQDQLNKSERLQKLSMQIGLAAGEALSFDGEIMGRTANVAARICSLASGGEILIAESVRALGVGHGVQLRELGPRMLKGLSEPIHIYEVQM